MAPVVNVRRQLFVSAVQDDMQYHPAAQFHRHQLQADLHERASDDGRVLHPAPCHADFC